MWTHDVGVGKLHPIVEQRLIRVALGLALVAAPYNENRCRWRKLLGEVAARFSLLRPLVTHDEHLSTGPVGPMGVDEYIRNRL